jgi:hypothetical protein
MPNKFVHPYFCTAPLRITVQKMVTITVLRKKMKTTKATTEPAAPLVKFVANVWHRAHTSGSNRIALSLVDDVFHLSVGNQDWNPPPSGMFPFFVKEFLRYAGVTLWPWTSSIRKRQCHVDAGDSTEVWTMSSTNLKQELTIERD